MFFALDINGNRVSALHDEVDWLRYLSKAGGIVCPECSKPLIYKVGNLIRSHFAHKQADCTYLYHEPETEEHIEGKILLFERLKQLFPTSTVELEYKITETQQRSDVMLIHPNGERWAFEFQCSPIPSKVWKQRHHLYKEANVKDVWIFGGSLANLSKEFIQTVSDSQKMRYHLYPETGCFHIFDLDSSYITFYNTAKHVFDSADRLAIEDNILNPLRSAFITNIHDVVFQSGRWWTTDYLEVWKQFVSLRDSVYPIKKAEYEAMQEMKRQQRNLFYKNAFIERESFTKDMTDRERNLFLELCSKHDLTKDTFPGFLHFNITNSSIYTPNQVWQLWVFDTYIYMKSSKYINTFRVAKEFIRLTHTGVFRLQGITTSKSISQIAETIQKF